MKAVESEVHDAHFTVDKQNISLWPRGKQQLPYRACPGRCTQTQSLLVLQQTFSSSSCRASFQDGSVSGSGAVSHSPSCHGLADAGPGRLHPAAGHSL